VALEDSGPLRATVRIDGAHGIEGGQTYLKYTARLTFWAGSPSVRLLYSIRNTNREANTAAKVRRAGVTLNLAVGQGVTHYLVGADTPRLSRLDVGEQQDLPKSTQRHWAAALEQRGPERAVLSVTDRATFHMGVEFDEIGYRVLMDQPGGRRRFADCGLACQGWLDLADDRGGCLLWLRNFTENPLKRLRADGYGRLDLDLIPEYDGSGQMFYAGGGYWITDSAYRTYELGFHFHSRPLAAEEDWKRWMADDRTTYARPTPETAARCRALVAAVKDPLLAVCDPGWYSRTGVLYGPVPSVEDENRVNKLWGRVKEGPLRANLQEELATEFLPRENYHWRSESDEPRDCLIEYIRTGRYDLLKRGRSFANVARDQGVFRCDGRPLGRRPAVNIATTQRERGLCEVGISSTKMDDCHNYGGGLVDMWLITGDRSCLEAAVDNVENHLGMSLRGEDRGSSRIADGALRLFEVTGDPRYRAWLKDSAVFSGPAPETAGTYVGSWMHTLVIFARYRNLMLNGEVMDPQLRDSTRKHIIAWAREAAAAADAPPAAAKSKTEYALCAIYTVTAGYELTGDRRLLEAAKKLWDKENRLGPDVVDARMQDWGPSSGANRFWVNYLFEAYAHPRKEAPGGADR
jgi:hypothetical protein